jgi:hypothetical protein
VALCRSGDHASEATGGPRTASEVVGKGLAWVPRGAAHTEPLSDSSNGHDPYRTGWPTRHGGWHPRDHAQEATGRPTRASDPLAYVLAWVAPFAARRSLLMDSSNARGP